MLNLISRENQNGSTDGGKICEKMCAHAVPGILHRPDGPGAAEVHGRTKNDRRR